VPAPSSSAKRFCSWGASSRSWVAQASESAVIQSSPSSNDSGLVWAASWGPTISGHLPKMPPTAARCCQPRVERRPSTAVFSGCGSSLCGRADQEGGSWLSTVAPDRSDESSFETPRPGWLFPACGRSPRAQASALALARASVASRTRSGSGRMVADQRAAGDRVARTGQHRGDVRGDRGGDQHLLRVRHQSREAIPAARV
jgi:hypothetical protein